MRNVLRKEVIASFKDAARKLTGAKRRAFQAQVTLDYLDGSCGRRNGSSAGLTTPWRWA